MILSVFLAVCAAGAAGSLLLAADRRLGPAASLVSLAAAGGVALLIGPTDRVVVGDTVLLGSLYAGTFLATIAAAAFGLTLSTALAGGPVGAAPAAVAALGGLGLAVTATDASVALAGAAVAGVAAAAASAVGWPAGEGPDNRTAEARTLALVVGSLLFAGLALSHPAWAGPDSPVLAVGLLGLAIALAVRSGAVPFHVPPARLAGRGASPTPALLNVWLPAGLGLLCVSWSAATFTRSSDWIELVAFAISAVAVTTIVLGGLGAILHDDPAEIAIYSIVADSGFILLALAARTDAAAAPARGWLLVFVASKTALLAWAAAMRGVFGETDLHGLRGWLRRSPVTGIALGAAVIAGIGWPGSVAWDSRAAIASAGVGGSLALVGWIAAALAAVCWGRVLIVGLLPASGSVPAPAHRRRWSRPGAAAAGDEAPQAGDADAAGPVEPPEPTAPAGPGRPAFGLVLDRSLAAGAAVAATALLALGVAAGSLGGSMTGSGIPLDAAARATATPAPTLTPAPTTPVPTLPPHETVGPTEGSPGPSESVTPGPTRSAAPPTIPQQ